MSRVASKRSTLIPASKGGTLLPASKRTTLLPASKRATMIPAGQVCTESEAVTAEPLDHFSPRTADEVAAMIMSDAPSLEEGVVYIDEVKISVKVYIKIQFKSGIGPFAVAVFIRQFFCELITALCVAKIITFNKLNPGLTFWSDNSHCKIYLHRVSWRYCHRSFCHYPII